MEVYSESVLDRSPRSNGGPDGIPMEGLIRGLLCLGNPLGQARLKVQPDAALVDANKDIGIQVITRRSTGIDLHLEPLDNDRQGGLGHGQAQTHPDALPRPVAEAQEHALLLESLQSVVQEPLRPELARLRVVVGIMVQSIDRNHHIVAGTKLHRLCLVAALQLVVPGTCFGCPPGARIHPEALYNRVGW